MNILAGLKLSKKQLVKTFILVIFLNIFPMVIAQSSNAATPSLYESLTGTNGTNINSTGSSDSIGFTGNWSMVNAYKNPGPMTGVSAQYRNSYNSNFKFPANSYYTFPNNNTAASTVANVWNVYYSARQISSPINFDSSGNFYLSFLVYSPVALGSWGSNVLGILNGLPTSSTDASKNAIFIGRTYSGAPTIQITTANMAVWNPSSYSATGTANNPADASDKSWFVVAKISTVSSGSDTIQLKFYASTDTLPITDSSITWDVSYSTAITGSYNYLSVQNEYNGTIDEIRGGSTYAAVSGVASSANIGAPSISGVAYKGISTPISITVGATGYIRFFMDGKRIPGCINQVTTGSSPNFTATCNWKPPVKGARRLNAIFTSTDASYLGVTSPSIIVQVVPRTNTR
jgi:hypothetical protein